MRVCLTGSTGFLGGHLALELLKRGDEVRATYRDETVRDLVRDRGLEPVRAEIADRGAMRRAARGCEIVFHTAGLVRSTPLDAVWEANALAPRVVVEAAAAEGVRRVVLTSSVSTLGPARPGRPITEQPLPQLDGGLGLVYADAKREGELEALAAGARTGVEVVVVNPSYVLGPPAEEGDTRPTSARIVSGYLRGRLPAVVDGLTNIVDVRDVARGHLRAAARGEPGERYVLGGTDIGWVDLVEQVRDITGVTHPFTVLHPDAASFARRIETFGLPVPVAGEGLVLMAQDWSSDSRKARGKLGYRTRKLETTLHDTIEWAQHLVDSDALGNRVTVMSMWASALRLADRVGALEGVSLAEKATGRRFVGGR